MESPITVIFMAKFINEIIVLYAYMLYADTHSYDNIYENVTRNNAWRKKFIFRYVQQ